MYPQPSPTDVGVRVSGRRRGSRLRTGVGVLAALSVVAWGIGPATGPAAAQGMSPEDRAAAAAAAAPPEAESGGLLSTIVDWLDGNDLDPAPDDVELPPLDLSPRGPVVVTAEEVAANPATAVSVSGMPTRLQVGESVTVDATVENTSGRTWPAQAVHLVSSWETPSGDIVQNAETALPRDLAPGETVGVEVTVTAPDDLGGSARADATVSWSMIRGAVRSGASLADGPVYTVAVEDSTSDQLGLEQFYTYAGKNTGAGSTVMNNVAAGNAVWSYDAFTNPGRGLSSFARFAYNSLDTSDTVLGQGWSAQMSGPIRLGAPLDFHPSWHPTKVLLPDGDGTTHVFRLNKKTGEWDAPAGVNYRLSAKEGVNCKPHADPVPDAWTMLRPDGTRFLFGCDGYLTTAVDLNGNQQTFTYAERHSILQPRKFLESVTDPVGRTVLTVEYWEKRQDGYTYVDDDGELVEHDGKLHNPKIYDHVRSVTDVSGRTIEMYYTKKGLLGRMIDGAGATDGDGDSVAKHFRFAYEARGWWGNKNKLVTITDPRGNNTELSYLDPKEGHGPKNHGYTRTITDRIGGVTQFDYERNADNDDWTDSTVTDAQGNTTSYVSDDFLRPRSVTNAAGETVTLTWDGDNNVRTLTEANGAVAAYCYDPRTGYPIWQRDAVQNEKHGGAPGPSECEPGMTAEEAPEGASVYEYATRGDGYAADIFRKTSPAGRMSQFTYDDVGNLLTVTDGKGIATEDPDDYTTSYTYDQYGQLATATDANGNTTTYHSFTPVGYPEVTTDPLGNESRVEFDVRGNVLESTDALGGTTTQDYDVFGRPLVGTVEKDDDENITTPAPVWDPNDNVIEATAPDGTVSSATYDAADQLVEAHGPDLDDGTPRVTAYTYDGVGNVLTRTEPRGALTDDPDDFTTTYTYDELYQQVAVSNADGDRAEYEYDDVGNVVEVRDPKKVASEDPDDFTSRMAYDLDHRELSSTDAVGSTTSRVYDADGLVTSTTDPDGNVSHSVYDERAMQVETKVPHAVVDGTTVYRTTTYEYDEVGNATKVTTPRGVETADPDDFAVRTEYDPLNRPVRQYQPYDPDDERHNDPNVFTETTYDALGRPTATSAPPSEGQDVRNTTTQEYFANGWLKASVDPWGIRTTYDYNDLGQQTARTLTSADGSTNRTMTWSFYPDGNRKSMSDDGVPVGSNVAVTDNSDNQSVETTGTWATATRNGQRGYDHRTHAQADAPSSDQFTWNLDVPADGTYQVSVSYPEVADAAIDASFTLERGDGTDETYTVDQTEGGGAWRELGEVELTANEPVSITLAPSTTGVVVADSVRLVRDNGQDEDAEQKTFTYEYDVNGNLERIEDRSAGAAVDEYAVTYDSLNQVSAVRELADGEEVAATSYTYDELGQPLTVAHPDQRSEFTYDDPRNLVTEVSIDDLNDDTGAKATTYEYTNRGEVQTETKDNGNVVRNAYYLDGALRSTTERKPDETVVASHEYTYDSNGHKLRDVASKMNADNHDQYLETTTEYSYSPTDRLSTAVKTGHGAGTETYVHDDNANVVSQTVDGTTTTYDYDRNRLLSSSVGGTTAGYNYDPFGRQVSSIAGGQVVSRTSYDGFDHVIRSEKLGDSGSLEATTYTFDPLDRTTTKTADGETTRYSYLGLSSDVLTEEVAGELTKSFQYSPWGQRLSQITHRADPGQDIEAGETAYYGYNAHTDVETLTDESGDTKATYGYTAYGSDDDDEFTGIDKPDPGNPLEEEPYNAYRYNSKRWDGSSQTYDMGFRDYSPGLNRFTTRDMYNGALADMGLGADPYTGNRYAFTGGNPISGIELDGHFVFAIPIVIGVGELIAAAAVVTVAALVAVHEDELQEAINDGIVAIEGGVDALTDWLNQEEDAPEPEFRPGHRIPRGTDDDPKRCEGSFADRVQYGALDTANGNRSTTMSACLIPDDLKNTGESPKTDPAGYAATKAWLQGKGVNTDVELNRCHLLAKRFGGSGDAENLATCLRGANSSRTGSDQGGNNMRAHEKSVADMLGRGYHVHYTVEPVYDGSHTVPTAFYISAYAFDGGGVLQDMLTAKVENSYQGQYPGHTY